MKPKHRREIKLKVVLEIEVRNFVSYLRPPVVWH